MFKKSRSFLIYKRNILLEHKTILNLCKFAIYINSRVKSFFAKNIKASIAK